VDLRSATRQQKLELEKVRLNFQRELELHMKVVWERVHAELAIIHEKDDEDANTVDNRSRLADHSGSGRNIRHIPNLNHLMTSSTS
nr:trihelix transcription factor ASIL2 [Tanacetum cinerariifolium]